MQGARLRPGPLAPKGEGDVKAIRIFVASIALAGAFAASTAVGDAATINNSCNGFLVNADGSKGNAIPGQPISLPLTLGGFGEGVDIPANASFTLVTPAGPVTIPATAPGTPLGDLPIAGVKNLIVDIGITGAAHLDPPSVSGGTVLGAHIDITAPDTLRLTLPGSQNGSAAPGGSTFTSPEVHTAITVGAAGTTLSGSIVGLQLDAQVDSNPATPAVDALNVRLECTPSANTLGTGNVVNPPAPGEPRRPAKA